MNGWMEICRMTRERLDRELKDEELAFLEWLYEKHTRELEWNKQKRPKGHRL